MENTVGNQRRLIYKTPSKKLSEQISLAQINLKEIALSQKIQILDTAVYFHFEIGGFVHARNVIGHDLLSDYRICDYESTKISIVETALNEIESFDMFCKKYKDHDLEQSYLKIISENGIAKVSFETFLSN